MAILIAHDAVSSITTISRRNPAPTTPSPKLHPLTSTDTSTWPDTLTSITPVPSIYFSALGTTKAAAGSIAAQRAIDFDLNLSLAVAAQKSGTKIYVLISSTGSNASSFVPYSKMKGQLEDAVKELGFETTVILRPGLLLGSRGESRFGESVAVTVAGWLGGLSKSLKDGLAQEADVVARAAVRSGLLALEGKAPGKVWVLGQADIVKMGQMDSATS